MTAGAEVTGRPWCDRAVEVAGLCGMATTGAVVVNGMAHGLGITRWGGWRGPGPWRDGVVGRQWPGALAGAAARSPGRGEAAEGRRRVWCGLGVGIGGGGTMRRRL